MSDLDEYLEHKIMLCYRFKAGKTFRSPSFKLPQGH